MAKKKTKKRAQRPTGRVYAVPKFKFKLHPSAESVLRAYVGEKDLGAIIMMDEKGKDRETAHELVEVIREQGLWGFVETRAKPPLIHYWHDGKQSESDLIHFFGHEMGHCVGKKLKDGWPEENRADDYGFVAGLAVEAARKALAR